jgi:phospho-N-acetylmuramoyl-pentapeptide-transferase
MFYKFLYPLAERFIFFNVFKYISFRTFGALLTAALLSFLLGAWQIRFLQKWQVTQKIRREGPKSHYDKAGTPTMGGILTMGCTIFSVLLWMDFENISVWLVLFLYFSYGLIGFYDDFRKIRYGSSKGLAGRYKLLFQFILAGAAVAVLVCSFDLDTRLSLPFFKSFRPDLGIWYLPFAVLVIVGASNAVNLTDGLDGLATGPAITSFLTYMVLAYLAGHAKIAGYLQIPHIPGSGELSIFCGAIIGALIGFLWFNTYPAQIFMGDVGSLPLGGSLGFVALVTKNEFLLVIVGGIFVLEAVSVMTQVASFKMTGKRIFKMAPIHHHFELKGWQEPKVIVRFWIISFVLALIALSTLKLR